MIKIKLKRNAPRALMTTISSIVLASFFVIHLQAASASTVFGSSVSKDWQTQVTSLEPGITVGLTYDYIKQDQQYSGRYKISSDELLANNPNSREIEQLTTTTLTTLDVNYKARDWSMDLQVPYVNRYHETNNTAFNTSQSNTLGDVRVISRFSATDDNSFGLIFGVKLPTGPINATFADGITPLDRSLQPGTGSGDVIIGAYTSGQLDKYDWFVQGLFQSAITTQSSPSTDLEYSPGDTKSLNMGIRYTSLSKTIEPMLQINMISRNSDTGSAATPLITGADLIYLTPGVSVKFGNSTTAFAFLQLPIYQNVNASDPNGVLGTGSQLTPIRILSIGVTHSI